MGDVLGFVWFAWPVTLATAASVTAVALSFDAARNQRPPRVRRGVALGAGLAFAVPALVELLGTRVACGDGFAWGSSIPGPLLAGLVLAGLTGLALLQWAAGPPARAWLVLVVVPAVLAGGFVAETFVAVGAFSAYCDEGSVVVLVAQAGLALLVPAGAVVIGRRIRPPQGELAPPGGRPW